MKIHGLFGVFLLALAVGCSDASPPSATPDASPMDAPAMDLGAPDVGTPDTGPRCPEGQSVCAGQCINTQTDGANCGACGRACPSGQMCSLGRCATSCDATLATCSTGADGGVSTTYCADARTDRLNCGACGVACEAGHVCVDRACVLSCAAGQSDCGGACRDLQSDDAHCGACDHACPSGNTCAAGICAASCGAGLSACSGSCANLATDNANCGACGATCPAGSVCSGGACGTTCAAPLTTCGSASSRFCADTAIDPANCGACGTACSLANVATSGCAAGACAVVRCASGHGDCDGVAANGCEVDTTTSALHCGGCGRACLLPHAATTCAAGECAVTTCDAGFADCDHVASNGCEVDTRTDNAHCGACGTGCAAGSVCSGGACGATCAAPLATCGTASTAFCANTAIDPSNCGACGTACALPGVAAHGCAAGACAVVRCNAGAGDCNGTASDGCETNLQTSEASCGACGRACTLANASATCTAGACAVTVCTAGFADCNGNPADGCEVDTRTDNASCGVCGTACAAGSVCSGGACTVTCQASQVNCAGACANLASDPSHCGACTTACPTPAHTIAYCAASACGAACNAGFGDCDGAASNGCEIDLAASATNCGACGRVCPVGASCALGACVCPAGQRAVGSVCVATAAVPRPVWPVSLGDVTQRRPTLRWALPAVFDGAAVELCRDRSCATPIETLTVVGSSARPTVDLPAHSVVFWRVRGRVGAVVDSVFSATWLFHVPAVSAVGGVDTSFNPHFDVNADGYDDLLVGSPNAAPDGRAYAGTVSVFFGSAAGISSTAARVLAGGAPGDFFGQMVVGAGDVNGDGYADLLVGAPGADPGGRNFAGSAYVFHGGAAGVGASAAVVLEGAGEGDNFGASVGSVGDANADGYADLVVSAQGATFAGRSRAGTATVFYGSAAGVAASASTLLGGGEAGAIAGRSVAGAGDVNGDGYDDLVVSSHGHDSGGTSVGLALVFQGSAAGIVTTPSWVFEGSFATDNFGTSVASAGDVNGDGCADLVVGAYGDPSASDDSRFGTASVFLGGVSGMATSASRVLRDSTANTRFGYAVTGAGDVNADGYADLAVGAFIASAGGHSSSGTVSLFHGSAAGVGDTATTVLAGEDFDERLGVSVAGLGDVNGDGFADLAAGAPQASVGAAMDAGIVRVFPGSVAGVTTVGARAIVGTAGDYFGQSVADARRALAPRRCVLRPLRPRSAPRIAA